MEISQVVKEIWSRFPSGVTVVTALADGIPHGMTANAVSSLSLDPPLLLVCVAHKAHMNQVLRGSPSFALSFLRHDQADVSGRFAKPGPKDFSGLEITTAVSGAPILKDAIAYADCALQHILPGGDHDIFVGKLLAGGSQPGDPLVYFHGKYRSLAALDKDAH